MNEKMLPPMPKLRPRPGLTLSIPELNPPGNNDLIPPPKKRKLAPKAIQNETNEDTPSPKPFEIVDEDAKTSRLLTKSECGRGGGRKRNSGSSIHSIPKFTEVRSFVYLV